MSGPKPGRLYSSHKKTQPEPPPDSTSFPAPLLPPSSRLQKGSDEAGSAVFLSKHGGSYVFLDIEENVATLNIEGKSRTSLSFPGS